MAFGPSSRRMFLSPKERNDPSASSRSLMPRKRNYYSADASSNGVGAVLLNVQDDGTKKPIASASRSMTVWPDRERSTRNHLSVRKVFQLVLGKDFLIETDHKPLVLLLRSKCLQDMPPRI